MGSFRIPFWKYLVGSPSRNSKSRGLAEFYVLSGFSQGVRFYGGVERSERFPKGLEFNLFLVCRVFSKFFLNFSIQDICLNWEAFIFSTWFQFVLFCWCCIASSIFICSLYFGALTSFHQWKVIFAKKKARLLFVTNLPFVAILYVLFCTVGSPFCGLDFCMFIHLLIFSQGKLILRFYLNFRSSILW